VSARARFCFWTGARKRKELAGAEVERRFCRVATVDEVRNVGSPESDEDEEPFEEKMPRLVAELERQFAEGRELEAAIRRNVSDWHKGA